jgi:hypothetical protein
VPALGVARVVARVGKTDPSELGVDSTLFGFKKVHRRWVPALGVVARVSSTEPGADFTSFEHPVREVRVLKRCGVGEGEVRSG